MPETHVLKGVPKKTYIHWDDEKVNLLKKLLDKGMNAKQIAKEFGQRTKQEIPVSCIKSAIKHKGLDTRVEKTTREKLEELGLGKSYIEALFQKGFNYYEVTDDINKNLKQKNASFRVTYNSLRLICVRHWKIRPLLSHCFWHDIDSNEGEEIINKMVEREKQFVAERAKDKVLRELTKKQAVGEMLSEAIQGAIYNLPQIDIAELIKQDQRVAIQPKTSQHEDEEMVLLISDVHYGEKTTAEETGGLIDYDSQRFLKQIDVLYKNIKNIYEIHAQVYKVPKINVMMLGDIVTNDNLFPGQGSQVDQNVVDQVFNCAHEFKKFFIKLMTIFPEIEVHCVAGNHGRISGKVGERPFIVNWDFILYKFLESSFKDQKGITIDVPRTWYKQIDIKGWTFTITHGEDVRGYLGMPYYNLEKAEMKYDKMMPVRSNYFIIAHHHRWAVIDSGRDSQVIVNGAWPGGSIFSAKRLMTVSAPSQLLFGIHRKHGKTWLYDIRL